MAINKKQFKAWLEEKSPSTTVGYAGNDILCPLGSFLKEMEPNNHFSVEKRHYTTTYVPVIGKYSYSRKRLTEWARKFVRDIDELYHYNNGFITSELALSVLREVTNED